MNFLYFASLKVIGLPFTLMDLLPIYNFVSSSLGYLENISSMRCADFLNANTFSLGSIQNHVRSPRLQSHQESRSVLEAESGSWWHILVF